MVPRNVIILLDMVINHHLTTRQEGDENLLDFFHPLNGCRLQSSIRPFMIQGQDVVLVVGHPNQLIADNAEQLLCSHLATAEDKKEGRGEEGFKNVAVTRCEEGDAF